MGLDAVCTRLTTVRPVWRTNRPDLYDMLGKQPIPLYSASWFSGVLHKK
jgi:hypothetical protein